VRLELCLLQARSAARSLAQSWSARTQQNRAAAVRFDLPLALESRSLSAGTDPTEYRDYDTYNSNIPSADVTNSDFGRLNPTQKFAAVPQRPV
jgi:hypothetical protein